MSIVLDGDKGVTQNTTEAARLPSGTTNERPANPVAGMIRFNTDLNYFEGYDPLADDWFKTSDLPKLVATGGTETTITDNGVDYKVHTFTSSGTLEVTQGEGEVEYLVVAGGGAGGLGGGGAGGYRCSVFGEPSGGNSSAENPLQLIAGSYSVVIGAGGIGTSVYGSAQGNPGSNSSFATIVSIGGGAGGGSISDAATRDGGSGGGGRNNSNTTGGAGAAGQGTDGGSGDGANGGGGAGQPGVDGSSSTDGGDGLQSNVDGSATFRAGGGGGGIEGGNTSGGLGGGTDGTFDSILNSPVNSGGGSGGTWQTNFGSAAGGSGIVIIRYPI